MTTILKMWGWGEFSRGNHPADHAADVVDHAADVVDHAADVVDHAADVVDHAGDVVDHAGDVVDHAGDVVDHAGDVVWGSFTAACADGDLLNAMELWDQPGYRAARSLETPGNVESVAEFAGKNVVVEKRSNQWAPPPDEYGRKEQACLTRCVPPRTPRLLERTITMTTRPRTSVATANNPTVVGTPADATPPPAAAPADPTTPVGISRAGKAILAATVTFSRALEPMVAVIRGYFDPIDPTQRQRRGNVSSKRVLAMPMIVDLLRNHSGLGSSVSPDAVGANLDAADAMIALSGTLKSLSTSAADTGRVLQEQSWKDLAPVYAAASAQAKHDNTMAMELAPIQAVLSQGPKVVTAAHTATTAQLKATKAQSAATKAQQKAETARQRAARAAGVATPEGNPQGPAGSGNGNPQGPAQGR